MVPKIEEDGDDDEVEEEVAKLPVEIYGDKSQI
jgi:hypothetical protein